MSVHFSPTNRATEKSRSVQTITCMISLDSFEMWISCLQTLVLPSYSVVTEFVLWEGTEQTGCWGEVVVARVLAWDTVRLYLTLLTWLFVSNNKKEKSRLWHGWVCNPTQSLLSALLSLVLPLNLFLRVQKIWTKTKVYPEMIVSS